MAVDRLELTACRAKNPSLINPIIAAASALAGLKRIAGLSLIREQELAFQKIRRKVLAVSNQVSGFRYQVSAYNTKLTTRN